MFSPPFSGTKEKFSLFLAKPNVLIVKLRKSKEEDLLRKNKHSLLFNNREMKAIEAYCRKYKVSNRSKFMRETILTEVLKKFEADHPTLFELEKPNLFSQ